MTRIAIMSGGICDVNVDADNSAQGELPAVNVGAGLLTDEGLHGRNAAQKARHARSASSSERP